MDIIGLVVLSIVFGVFIACIVCAIMAMKRTIKKRQHDFSDWVEINVPIQTPLQLYTALKPFFDRKNELFWAITKCESECPSNERVCYILAQLKVDVFYDTDYRTDVEAEQILTGACSMETANILLGELRQLIKNQIPCLSKLSCRRECGFTQDLNQDV